MTCYFPLQGYKNRYTGAWTSNSEDGVEPMAVACGSCLGCRIDRSRMWAIRIVHEATLHDDNCFITLTYRSLKECTVDQYKQGLYLPKDGSLNKKHFKDFMKRLRKAFPDKKIRYFHCGEYGKELSRPHYHACLFNVRFPDLVHFGSYEHGEEKWNVSTSPMLEKIWKYGFCTVGELNFKSAAYCARYILDKITGWKAEDHYFGYTDEGEETRLQPEYCTMSRKPGIGRGWFEKYKDDCYPSDDVPVPGVGVIKKIPRYYDEVVKVVDEVLFEKVSDMRSNFRLESKDEYTAKRLLAKYKVMKARKGMLKRGFENDEA